MQTVYLCGPINKCTDAEAMDWRKSAKLKLSEKFSFLDPMRRDYRGRELEPGIAKEIVAGDKEDIENSQVILAYCPKPSVGTSMELMLAWLLRKTIVVVHPPTLVSDRVWWKPWTWFKKHWENKPSPWLMFHSDKLFETFEEAFAYIQTL